MAKIRIKMIRAYDSSSGSMIGTSVPDMFRALQTPHEMEETKADIIIAKAQELAEAYANAHPGESFMPSIMVLSGRKPVKIDEKTKAMERQWLRTEEEVISASIG